MFDYHLRYQKKKQLYIPMAVFWCLRIAKYFIAKYFTVKFIVSKSLTCVGGRYFYTPTLPSSMLLMHRTFGLFIGSKPEGNGKSHVPSTRYTNSPIWNTRTYAFQFRQQSMQNKLEASQTINKHKSIAATLKLDLQEYFMHLRVFVLKPLHKLNWKYYKV